MAVISDHAKRRMEKYGLPRELVERALESPDSIMEGHSGRCMAQLNLNGYVLRVVFEKEKNSNVVITTYRARSERYEI